MFKATVAQQKKQKILNYQIQVIEECPQSLFTQGNCQHHRYLGWQLGESLQQILLNYNYIFRWLGNDQNAHIYAYFYIAIIGCSGSKSSMLQLKAVMYELSKKYLAQFQQKFLIQFLCLIEYSEDKFHFFRKYQKMEGILLKIFKQIQSRHPLTGTQSLRPSSQQQNPISYITTSITSPSKSRQAEFQKSKILRNSDYYNSSMKKVEQQYRADLLYRMKKDSNFGTIHFISWYQTYNKIFNFMKMLMLSQQNVKFQIETDKKQRIFAQFIVTVEKGCFFVVEMFKIDKSASNNCRKDISQLSKPCSAIEESEQYLNRLLEKQIKQSSIKKDNFDFRKPRTKKERLSFTPKFISNKKKLSWNNSNDLYSGDINGKNVQIEVLDLSQFNQNTQTNQASFKDITEHSKSHKETESKNVQYPNKITDLRSIGETVRSIQKNSIIQEIRSHPSFDLYKNNIKGPRNFHDIVNVKASNSNQYSTGFASQKCLNRTLGFQMDSAKELPGTHFRSPNGGFGFNKTVNNKQTSLCSISQNASTLRVAPDGKVLMTNKISGIPPNQTFLSAKNLKKKQNLVYGFRKNNIMQEKAVNPQSRQFHSYSPPQPLIDLKKNALRSKPFYSPSRPQARIGAFSAQEYGPKIKFTYL